MLAQLAKDAPKIIFQPEVPAVYCEFKAVINIDSLDS